MLEHVCLSFRTFLILLVMPEQSCLSLGTFWVQLVMSDNFWLSVRTFWDHQQRLNFCVLVLHYLGIISDVWICGFQCQKNFVSLKVLEYLCLWVGTFGYLYWCLDIHTSVSEHFGIIKYSWTFMSVLENSGTIIDAWTFISLRRNILVSWMMLEHSCLSFWNNFN
jgi:hypothetical protein